MTFRTTSTRRGFSIISTIFTAVFLSLFTVFGLLINSSLKHDIERSKNFIETTATIVEMEPYFDSDGDRSYYVYISYNADGKEYPRAKMNEYDSSMHVGKEIKIKYNPEDPTDFVTSYSGEFSFIYNLSEVFIFGGIYLAFISICFSLIKPM